MRSLGAMSCIVAISLVLSATPCAFAWSNGGWSADPSNPDYGTHDWIAQHAIAWLPPAEKNYILNNLSAFLYGTELPDRPSGSGGIGDTWYHHIYFDKAGKTLYMEDDAAWRASTEFNKTTTFLKSGKLDNASRNAGIIAHYISDVSVWSHVIGSPTKDTWGTDNATRHSDYETHIAGEMTGNNSTQWDKFLKFDYKLETVSAYNATVTLARNTTFGENGKFNCTWMNATANNWTDQDFVNRTGHLLNLAVNTVTDVLHTLAVESGYASSQVKPYEVKINEIESNPPGPDDGAEWVELFNPTKDIADISGWYFEAGMKYQWMFVEGTHIAPGAYLTVDIPCPWLVDANDGVTLFTPYGVEIDGTPWLTDLKDDGQTWARLPNGVDANSTFDWTFQKATKNMTNDPPSPSLDRPPLANFTVNPISGYPTTRFIADASASFDPDGDSLTFKWSWGDGTPNSTGRRAAHFYDAPGIFTIVLAVDDNNGSINSTAQDVEVLPPPAGPDNPPGIGYVTATPDLPTGMEKVVVTVSASDDRGLKNVTVFYRLSGATAWGDRTLETIPYAFQIGPFPKGSTVQYYVMAVDNTGQTARYPTSGELLIMVRPNILPVARLAVSSSRAFVEVPITFDGTGSFDLDGRVSSYRFDFGDGAFAGWTEGAVATHSYSAPGEYNVKLAIRDDDQTISYSEITTIRISFPPKENHPPVVSIADPPMTIKANQTMDVILDVSDPDGDLVQAYIVGYSDGVQLTGGPSTGKPWHLVWSPREDQAGVHELGVEVSDGRTNADHHFIVTVEPSAQKPPPKPKKDNETRTIWVYLLIAFVIIIVIIILLLLLFRPKRQHHRKGHGKRHRKH